jgi:hypothetical protein
MVLGEGVRVVLGVRERAWAVRERRPWVSEGAGHSGVVAVVVLVRGGWR